MTLIDSVVKTFWNVPFYHGLKATTKPTYYPSSNMLGIILEYADIRATAIRAATM